MSYFVAVRFPAFFPHDLFMLLRIHHLTHFRYRAPVTGSSNELRLHPVSSDPNRLPFFLLNVQPPTRLRHFRDDFLNHVHWFELPEPHTELRIEATSQVHTSSPYADGMPAPVDFSDLVSDGLDDGLHPFLGDSPYITLDPNLWRLALDIRDGRPEAFSTALAIMDHLHGTWKYDASATHVGTTATEAMRTQAGVCQDFAHVMIGLCRSLGIPARYVSGYLHDGSGGLRGAQASHAWCEVHLPGQGWFGLDPTNRCPADDRHVKIATGRDYSDAAPIRGTLTGPTNATREMLVEVEIERLD
jgi:transglutaminase-like putative cysteine protease